MTAKHRKGKNNHKHEDNFFKNDVMESEVRAAGNNYTVALVLVLVVVLGGAIGAWFCFQQHQTLTYLTDNLMGIQMKIAKLQSSHEELRQSSGKHISDGLVSRLNALEESYSLAQKQVGMALATAEQLKTSDLPAQVLSLHTEMKTRLAEMQQATVSMEQLGHIQSLVQGNSEKFEGVRLKLEALAAFGDGLSLKVEALESNLGTAESKLTEQVATLSASLDGQAAEVLSLREQLEEASVRAEVQTEQAPEVTETVVEEQMEPVLENSAPEVLEQAEEPQEATTEEELISAKAAEEEVVEDVTEEEVAEDVTEEEVAEDVTEEEVAEDVTEEEPAAPEEFPVEEEAPEESAPAMDDIIESEQIQEETTENQEEVESDELIVEDTLLEAEVATPEEEAEKIDEGVAVEDAEEEEKTQDNAPKEDEDILEQPTEAEPEEELETEELTEEETMEQAEEQPEEAPEVVEEEQELVDSPAEDTSTVEDNSIVEDTASAAEPEVAEIPEVQEEQIEEVETNDQIEPEPQPEESAPLEEIQDTLEDKSPDTVSLPASPSSHYSSSDLPLVDDMQAFAPRHFLAPVRDEEAESQRKAKSRHARQTRRSTQGVTLTELKEAQKSSLSSLDPPPGGAGVWDDRRASISLTESMVPSGNKVMDNGNIESRLEVIVESPDFFYSPTTRPRGLSDYDTSNNCYKVNEGLWRDENHNPIEDTALLTFASTRQPRQLYSDAEDRACAAEHERLSRYDSSGETATDKPLGRTSSYTRREARLAALNRTEPDTTSKDYKKMYEEALHENEKLKSRLHDSKQELSKLRSQLEKVTQKQDRLSERSTALESEKREKQALEKRVSDMEEEIKVLTELKSDNQRLKDENGALIRVISKLSK